MPTEFQEQRSRKKLYRLKPGKRHTMRSEEIGTRGLLVKTLSGQVVGLTEAQAAAFSDKFDGPIQDADGEDKLVEKAMKSVSLTIRDAGGAWYDVLDQDGKPINDKKLRLKAAEELVKASQAKQSVDDEDDKDDD